MTVEVEFFISSFPQHTLALPLLQAVSPSVVCAGWSLLKLSDNPGEKQTRPPWIQSSQNSNCFSFQPPEPSSVKQHSHYSQMHHPSFLTPSDTTWPQFWVYTNVHYYKHVLERSIRFLCEVLEMYQVVLWPESLFLCMWTCTPPLLVVPTEVSSVQFLRPYWLTKL